jgi:uncharacterized repeat protein (TIGR03803 family)
MLAAFILWPLAHSAHGSITFTEIHGFVNYDSVNGYNSQSALVQHSNGDLYGTTCSGGVNNEGTVFGINTNGSWFDTLVSFNIYNGGYIGGGYIAGPIEGTDGYLYGTTENGGANLAGEVYQVTGSGINVLYSFTGGNDGDKPYAGLVQGVDGNCYGTTTVGGYWTYLDPNNIGYGTVFKVTPTGTLTTLYSFSGSDGFDPCANLVQGKDGNMYGATRRGGAYGYGTIFKISTNGILNTLYSFTGSSDGAWPLGGMVQGADNNLYGTTYYRGAYTSLDSSGNGYGTIFKITTTGVLTTLASFDNTNGANPNSTLVIGTDGNFYGTTVSGLTDYPPIPGIIQNFGTVFQMTPAGVITTVVSFDYMNGYGADPNGLAKGNDGNIYGTCQNGGSYFGASGGIVFRLNLPPTAPFIITQPIGHTNNVGITDTFVVTAGGTGPLHYQWRTNGAIASGATNYTYVLTNVQTNQSGNYDVVITNVGGSITSSIALLFVDGQNPTITITNPAANARLSNAVTQVSGTASDNGQVAQVFYQLNTGGWMQASGTNSWKGSVTLFTPGTNKLSAYSVDRVGNRSATNSENIDYVVTALVTVHTNGSGTISPNYNGQLLEIGQNYTMTATAGTGFMFTNWTGSIATNNPTLIFTMASNLTFTANFVDTNKPVVAITNVTAGMNVSNASFTVMGTATDNVAVASVYYSLNNSPFASAQTANNWANWSTNLALVAGTNTIAAYAMDNSGNISPTNSVKLVYVLSATLTVRTNGIGSISPNYGGSLLAVGQNYSMTATPGTGFAFTNWTGGTSLPLTFLTNGTTVAFLMQSNLVLQANFVDVQKPVLAITNLTSGQQVSNAVFIVKGTAADNWQLSNVLCQINGGGWNSATNINNWTNWAAGVALVPGTNTVAAYAVDTSGNLSTTNSLSFQFVVTNQLQVRAVGLGTLSPNYSNAWLNVGQNYSMSASPGTGFVFTNWTGGTALPLNFLTDGTTVTFLMQSNLVLQANFVDTQKPVLAITNLTSGQRVSNAMFTVKGTASDNWQVGNVAYYLNSGAWSNALTVNSWTNWSATVNLVPGTNTIAAYAADTTGNLSTTNAVSFQYVVTNLLGVQTTGLGTISPNYSNAWLNIGQNYSMTATPGSGFVVTNWTISTNWIGGRVTNNATVQFMMASNLTLQVNFADVTKPTLTITAPTAGQHMTNALATFAGTASDNWKVSAVWYQLTNSVLTGGTWSLAITTNGYTNWTTTVTLAVGTNTIKAYAVDLGGNYSTTNNLSVLSSNTFKLQLAFTNTLPLKTNGLVFSLQLSAGLNGHIQVSTNLTSWDVLTNFTGTNTTLNFRDPAATNSSHRYYRAVIP